MTGKAIQQEINATLWRQYCVFRSAVDTGEYVGYFVSMLFLKYLSDVRRDQYLLFKKQYGNDEERIDRRLQRDKLVLPYVEIHDSKVCGCQGKFLADYYSLYERREASDLGELINCVFEHIELANKDKLAYVFCDIDFNSESRLGNTIRRNRILRQLLEALSEKHLDLRPSHIGGADVMGRAWNSLLGKFAASAERKTPEFFTPPAVSLLMAKLVAPKTGERICDPACGSGSLLIQCAKEAGLDKCFLFGQEGNRSIWVLCMLNLVLHGVYNARVEWADTLLEPRLVEGDKLMKFEVVVSTPQFSLDKWGADQSMEEAKRFNRWHRGVPPKSRGDFAFISHMIETTNEPTGRMVVAVPHGVLFRGGVEGKIRRQLIEENLLDIVIGLPPNVFYGTGIPAVILLFRRDRGERTNVLFIDASREFVSAQNQNIIRADVEVKKIIEAVKARQSVRQYAYLATYNEIAARDFNLNISSYVDVYEKEPVSNVHQIQGGIKRLEQQLEEVRKEIATTLRNLDNFV